MAAARAPWHHDKRSRRERGYGPEWDRKRLVILARDGHLCRCEDCRRTGAVMPATEVDHVVSKAAWLKRHGSLDGCEAESNLQAINRDCHTRKTQREMGNTVRAGADLSGRPLDPGHHWNRPGG